MNSYEPEPAPPVPGDPAQPDGDTQPGALRGSVTLTLETRQAQRLVQGRPRRADKPTIIGLIGFAKLLRTIWQGAAANDPYADWWLIKVHEALEVADEALQASLEAVQHELAATTAIHVTPATSVRPVHTPLRFSNPYAFRGAHLLAAYDQVVRAVMSAQHVGLLTRADAERHLAWSGRQLRRAFQSPVGYQLTGVTRDDVRQATGRYAQTCAHMGEVPTDILSGEQCAPYAPVRRTMAVSPDASIVKQDSDV